MEYKIKENGDIFNKYGEQLKTFVAKNGYLLCFLYIGGVRKAMLHHRLIAKKFIPNPENKPYVNHINGDKTDNRVSNLEWVTPKENAQHSIKVLNKINKGGDQPKLNRLKAELIRHFYRLGKNKSELAREYGVQRTSISKIINYKSYKEQYVI